MGFYGLTYLKASGLKYYKASGYILKEAFQEHCQQAIVHAAMLLI